MVSEFPCLVTQSCCLQACGAQHGVSRLQKSLLTSLRTGSKKRRKEGAPNDWTSFPKVSLLTDPIPFHPCHRLATRPLAHVSLGSKIFKAEIALHLWRWAEKMVIIVNWYFRWVKALGWTNIINGFTWKSVSVRIMFCSLIASGYLKSYYEQVNLQYNGCGHDKLISNPSQSTTHSPYLVPFVQQPWSCSCGM